ncbi:MAG: hypothetical protein LDL39_08585, partial [Magnetospirillum sp.]|nr:hypothetical protein [Magnetospirillum sp.]
FRVLGNFVLDGLGPARTMEDIQREEREARARELQSRRETEEKAVVAEPAPPAPVAAAAPVATQQPQDAVKLARVEPAKPLPAEVKPAAVPVVPVDIIPPPPKARPQLDAKALPAGPAVPAEPLKSHIAATASVDQALRLGGPMQIYKRRLAVD